jgi:FMNH2-dependent dimethyl sulfone monooxygenase
MRFGIWTPLPHTVYDEQLKAESIAASYHRGEEATDIAYRFALDTVMKAEGYGFDITLVAERFLGTDLESWMLAAALAAKTRSIGIMPAVHPGIVAPQLVAKMAASLDRISNGRVSINVVNGWNREEFATFGNGSELGDDGMRYRRMDEFVQVVKGLWENDSFAYDGEFYNFGETELLPRPKRASALIYAASRADEGKRVIANQCNLWFASYGLDPEQRAANDLALKAQIDEMRAQAASVGREIEVGIAAFAVCSDTLEEGQSQVDTMLEYAKHSRPAAIAVEGLRLGLYGPAPVIAQRIVELENLGVDLLMLRFTPMMDQLDVFAQRVMPLIKA